MRSSDKGAAIPLEIARARRRRLKASLRLYAGGFIVLAGLCAGLLVVEGGLLQHSGAISQHLAQAETAYTQGDVNTAEHELRAITSLDAANYFAHYDLGLLLLKTGRYTAALTELHRAARLDSSSASLLFAAATDLALHRATAAQAEAQQAVRIDPNEWDTNAVLAMADRALGRAALARQEFARAVSFGYDGRTLGQLIDSATLMWS